MDDTSILSYAPPSVELLGSWHSQFSNREPRHPSFQIRTHDTPIFQSWTQVWQPKFSNQDPQNPQFQTRTHDAPSFQTRTHNTLSFLTKTHNTPSFKPAWRSCNNSRYHTRVLLFFVSGPLFEFVVYLRAVLTTSRWLFGIRSDTRSSQQSVRDTAGTSSQSKYLRHFFCSLL